ncbi:MAG: alpha/beta fold hydrolase [Nitriliruptorales bacterium]|nr:alpha/beta fold hydrolase [Nitriliruptorales bacterium]
MVTNRTLGLVGFAGAAIGGVGLGLLTHRRAAGARRLIGDPEWAELHRPLPSGVHKVVSFDGTALHAEVSGPEGAPALLLVHGYGMGLRSWHYQRRDLPGEFRVIAYDQRGHGQSERAASGDYSIRALGRDVGAVLGALVSPPAPVVAAGHSLGGMSILSFVGSEPDRVAERLAGVAFVGSTIGNVLAGGVAHTGVAALAALEHTVMDRGRRMLGRERREEHADQPPADLSTVLTRAVAFGPDAVPAHVAFVEQLLLECPNTVKAELGPTVTALDLRDAPPLVTVPALVLVGEHDRLTPPASARRLAASLPDACLVEIPGAGHMAPIEAHEMVTSQVRSFARRVLAEAA